MAVRKGKQIAAALEALIHAMGFNGCRQRQPKRRQQNSKILQCYNCQQLGHTARECKNAVACLKCAAAHDTRSCTKPRGVASSCADCGGPHAANSRSCGYLRESHRLAAAPRPAAASSATTTAPPPRSGEGCEPRRLEAASDQAMAGFQAAFAAERAALKEELAAVHRQLQQLRDELRAIKKQPPVPAAPPLPPPPPASRPVGVDAATQSTDAPSPAAVREAAPMDTDDVSPGQPPKEAAARKCATAPPDCSQVEQPKKKRKLWLPFPKVDNVQELLKCIASTLPNGSFPYSDLPYPFTLSGQPKPPLPHQPFDLRT
ncbi:uncharacterized protein LOC126252276 [Schistocerca nitens]|uniref:uncharacterized protein LOC126252276 n=1 Tax=Schistocerca nitens TaxID=7011 RepID=UPI002118E50D|nr:uncharacterized protein LOC126252276 [Schistocerca nitens]